MISPNGDAAWKHEPRPVTKRGRAELWHTRLVLKGGESHGELSSEQAAPLRAIWSPDFEPARAGSEPLLGLTAMTADDREQIVILTSAFHGYEVDSSPYLSSFALGRSVRTRLPLTRPYVPQPFWAESLMLSALGGWLRSRGDWTPPHRARPRRFPGLREILAPAAPKREADRATAAEQDFIRAPVDSGVGTLDQLDLSEWVHVATQGRDHYVRIVYEGRLLPFGHRASLVKVTERKFERVGDEIGAYLMQRMFVVVREPVRKFGGDERAMPFKLVRITTLVTPDIVDPRSKYVGSRSFWVEVRSGGAEIRFPFHCVGTDIGGNPVDFTIPMMFVSDAEKQQTAVLEAYNCTATSVALAARDAQVPGQKVVFAEAKGNDNTRLVAESLNFMVGPENWRPALLTAVVRIPQLQELLGSDETTTIRLYPPYVSNSFDTGAEVFAEIARLDPGNAAAKSADPRGAIIPDASPVEFQAQTAGGIATPNLGMSILSRKRGPLAGAAADAVTDDFDPASFFGSKLAHLFGSFDLSQLVPAGDLAANAPRLTTTSSDDGAGGRFIETSIHWVPAVQSAGDRVAKFSPDGSTLTVDGLIRRHLSASGSTDATFSFTGTLTSFEVTILDVALSVQSFAFTAANGEKPNVSVHLKSPPISFTGDLKFVNDLRDAIPAGLFGAGPSIDLTDNPAGVRAGFATTLPPLAVGVFALKDVALGAALTLPFTSGKPVFDFNVSRRDHPFLVAVAIFGGGGFFHLQVDTAGIKELEAAIEFGATASLDIGVASGGVHIMAGIYFSLQRKQTGTELASTLSGYLRMGGYLSVLGIVSISVEFNLTFAYDSDKDKAYGRATLTVHVEVALLSKSVDLTVERGFGGQGDPKFRELFTTTKTWTDYALAFA